MGLQPDSTSTGGAATSAQASAGTVQSALVRAAGHYRWIVCALLFFAATINYVDRQVLALLKQSLQSEIKWTEIEYGHLIFTFQLAYAIALLFAGKVMDWLGTRKGFSLSVLFWSIAAMAHALAHSVFGFGVARFALGQFPRLHQGGCGVVSQKRTGPGDRDFQFRHKHRRHDNTACSGMGYAQLRLANGVYCHWRSWFFVAGCMARAL